MYNTIKPSLKIMGKLTDKQKLELIEDFKINNDLNVLSIKYGIHRSSIRGLLKRRGLKLKNGSESRRIYSINENFFDEFNENSLYVLGILYADGYHNEKRKSIRLSLKESDEELLLKINNLIGSNRPLGVDTSRGEGYTQKYLDINNVIISEKLLRLGCVQNKTFKITFPDFLPQENLKHFIRGYYDGDGGLTIYEIIDKKTKKLTQKYKLTFRGTKDFCEKLKFFLNIELGVGGSISIEKIPSLSYSGKNQIIEILDYVYSDSTIYMDRKYQKYKTIKNEK
jgi:hypothetical protein